MNFQAKLIKYYFRWEQIQKVRKIKKNKSNYTLENVQAVTFTPAEVRDCRAVLTLTAQREGSTITRTQWDLKPIHMYSKKGWKQIKAAVCLRACGRPLVPREIYTSSAFEPANISSLGGESSVHKWVRSRSEWVGAFPYLIGHWLALEHDASNHRRPLKYLKHHLQF